MKVHRDYYGVIIYVGPWCGRVNWHPKSSFGWGGEAGRAKRFVRRWWSGWHRWDDEEPAA